MFISPLGFAINKETRYSGIEKLVWQYAAELVKTQDVTVLGHADSIFSEGIKVLPYKPHNDIFDAELPAYQTYQHLLRTFDVIHDFSHLHLASRFNVNLPSLNIFWHAPALAKYPKAPYNIIAPSQWAAREFERVYHQKARYHQSICIDPEVYKPLEGQRNDRFLVVGRMGAEKGNLNAVRLCKELGVPLDIITARGLGYTKQDEEYEKRVLSLCDGDKIKVWWEKDYTEASKIKMMQTNKALIYMTDHPEVTNHKVQESIFCGQPVIVPSIGAMPEIVTHGVDGYLCFSDAEYLWAIKNVDKLTPGKTHEEVVKKYSIKEVVASYISLYEQVKAGLRW